MKLPAAWRREPTASRLFIVGTLLMCGLLVGAMTVGGRYSWAGLLPAVILFPILLAVIVVTIRRIHPTRLSFDVTDGAFLVPPMMPFGFNLAVPLILLSNALGSTLARHERTWALIFIAPMVLVMAPLVVLAWRGARQALTPTGIEWRTPFNSIMVPWEALAPGGPARHRLSMWTTGRIQLATTRPDLVVKRGWHPFGGSREFPVLVLQGAVHPWLVVDAIRWYAEHPEHRAGIGSRAEHDRLLATLAPALPPGKPEVARPPRPQAVTAAAWLTWFGVGWGLLFAGWNLFAALAFHDRIVAAELAAQREEELATGLRPGETLIGGASQSTGFAIAGLVLAVVAGIGALLLVRSMSRGSDVARIGLIVLCGAIVVWAFCGAWTTSPMLLADNPDSVGGFTLLAQGLNQGVCVVLGIAICVLLLLEPASRYFRPGSVPD